MIAKVRGFAVGMLATAVLAVMVPVGGASAAQAAAPHINLVACTSNEFLRVHWHLTDQANQETCYANAGSTDIHGLVWLTEFWTGNNRVQWYGDGRWQPARPVGKWTHFTFPHHPGGVKLRYIRIS